MNGRRERKKSFVNSGHESREKKEEIVCILVCWKLSRWDLLVHRRCVTDPSGKDLWTHTRVVEEVKRGSTFLVNRRWCSWKEVLWGITESGSTPATWLSSLQPSSSSLCSFGYSLTFTCHFLPPSTFTNLPSYMDLWHLFFRAVYFRLVTMSTSFLVLSFCSFIPYVNCYTTRTQCSSTYPFVETDPPLHITLSPPLSPLFSLTTSL